MPYMPFRDSEASISWCSALADVEDHGENERDSGKTLQVAVPSKSIEEAVPSTIIALTLGTEGCGNGTGHDEEVQGCTLKRFVNV